MGFVMFDMNCEDP